MKVQLQVAFVLFAALPLSACGENDTMSDGRSSMQSALSDTTAETEQHVAACQKCTSIADLVQEQDRHDRSVASLLNRMDSACGQMERCSGVNYADLSSAVGVLRGAANDHSRRLRSCADADAAHNECAGYEQLMAETMNSIEGDLSGKSCMGN